MIERPLLFSAPMVNATLADIKTQTRRTMNSQPASCVDSIHLIDGKCHFRIQGSSNFVRYADSVKCPFGIIGDQLWIRESYRLHHIYDGLKASEVKPEDAAPIFYEADGFIRSEFSGKLRPSIFMTRWASRINLLIKGVHAEKLQDISEADAIAEGITKIYSGVTGADLYAHHGAIKIDLKTLKPMVDTKFAAKTAKEAFEKLWVSINGQKSWDANPWVWVITYQRLKNTLPNPLIQGE